MRLPEPMPTRPNPISVPTDKIETKETAPAAIRPAACCLEVCSPFGCVCVIHC